MTGAAAFRARIAVIGAGIAGLAAARALKEAGHAVAVFEKSRGLGGRLATRRPFGRDHALGIDHGAPTAEAKDSEILAMLAELGRPFAPNGGPMRGVVGVPGMSDLVKPLADKLTVSRETEIAEIAQGAEDWLLIAKTGDPHGPFDAVVVAAPAPQTAALLGAACPDVATARMAPCWTLILAFSDPIGAPLDWLAPDDGGPFELLVRDAAKPGRSGEEAWVGHTRADWAQAHLEEEKPAMAEHLLAAFGDALEIAPPTPRYAAAHRWRYARTATPVGRAFWLSDAGDLGCCGDWRLGPTVGDAFKSGSMLGAAMAKKLAAR